MRTQENALLLHHVEQRIFDTLPNNSLGQKKLETRNAWKDPAEGCLNARTKSAQSSQMTLRPETRVISNKDATGYSMPDLDHRLRHGVHTRQESTNLHSSRINARSRKQLLRSNRSNRGREHASLKR